MPPAILRSIVSLCLLLSSSAFASASDPPIQYRISLDRRHHHELRIEVRFPALPPGPLEVRMSRTSPGRYALHEFAKNVYGVEITDPAGEELVVERPDLHQWTVAGHSGEVRFRYTLFGDRCDGTYAAIDTTHAHLNVPATFVWARGLEERPIEVVIEGAPDGWQVGTQLQGAGDGRTFTAPDLAFFIDSPLEIGAFDRHSWTIDGTDGRPQTIELALHHDGSDSEGEAFAELVKLVVDEHVAIFGEAPEFDSGRYTFLADYLPWSDGDGMEHRNSTVLTSPTSIADNFVRLLGTVSHEFFHAWNMERIRPHSLEPFDLEAANVSRELWFGEGFTSYYGTLVLARIGALSLEGYATLLTDPIVGVLNAPGRAFFSAAEMSAQAPFVDAATANDPTNRSNTFISYYTYGNALGLALDLELRRLDPALSLDALMRAAWARFGKTEVPYTNDGLEALLAEVTGDPAFARYFFDRSVLGHDSPDFAPLLEQAGLVLRHARPDTPWIGAVGLRFDGPGARLDDSPPIGSPLYDAGLDRGDVLLHLDGRSLTAAGDLDDVLDEHACGDTLELDFESRAGEQTVEIVLAQDPALEIVTFEAAGIDVTPDVLAFRSSWLGAKATPRTTVHRYCPYTGEPYPLAHNHCPVHGSLLVLVRPE